MCRHSDSRQTDLNCRKHTQKTKQKRPKKPNNREVVNHSYRFFRGRPEAFLPH